MASEREKVLTEALRLPSDDRATIAGVLLRSLEEERDEDEQAVEAAWAEEIRRRLQDLNAGTTETLSVEEARRFITDTPEDR